MKMLRISRNGLELATVSLRQPVSTLGRSPTCDGVLRAPGVRPLHFLFESQGPESNRWVLFDISNDSGEGVVVGDGKIEFKGFYFEVSEGALDAVDEIGGGIQRSLQPAKNIDGSPARLVEAVRIRRDSGAVQEVSHLLVPQTRHSRARRIRPFEEVSSIELSIEKGAVKVGLKATQGGPSKLKHQRNSEPGELLPGNSLELGTSDWIKFDHGEEDLYFRWVARVAKVPVPREVIGNPILRWGMLISVAIALSAAAWIAWRVRHPREPVIQQPPRIATVEVKEAAPPPPPPPVQEIPKAAPAPKAKAEAQQKAVSAAPKFAKPAPAKTEPKPGLNAPAPPTDVNMLGLLGALKPSAPTEGAGVRADQIFDDGVVSQAAAGTSGSIALKTPPSGALDLGKAGGAPKSKGDGLQALSTTLSQGADYAPKDAGPVVTSGTGGKALGSGLEGIGTLAGAGVGGAEDGSGTEVKGGLDRETVRRVIKSNRGKVQACYERALMAAPKLAGRVVTQFDISPKGAVISANVRNSDVQSKTLESCLVEVVKQMAFPEAPTGVGTRVIYPFVFQARSN